MSDDTNLADEIAAIFREEAAPIFAEAFHPDRYQVIEVTYLGDGRSGRKPTEGVIESGRCALEAANKGGYIKIVGAEFTLTAAPYRAELPRTSVIEAKHVLRVAGRGDFVLMAPPKLGGDADMFTVLELEERPS